MIEMTYTDAYDIERRQTFENPNDFIRVLMGCSTLPEYYPIKSVIYKGKDLASKGPTVTSFQPLSILTGRPTRKLELYI